MFIRDSFHLELLDSLLGSEFSNTNSFDSSSHVSNCDSRVAYQTLFFSYCSCFFGIQLDLGFYVVGPLLIESPRNVEGKRPLPVVTIGFGNVVIGGL